MLGDIALVLVWLMAAGSTAFTLMAIGIMVSAYYLSFKEKKDG